MVTMNRSLWAAEVLYNNRGMDGRTEVREERDAILVGSKLRWVEGPVLHAPCFDLDFNVIAYPNGATTWVHFEGMDIDEEPGTPDFLDELKTLTPNRRPTIKRADLDSLQDLMSSCGLINLTPEIPRWFRFHKSMPMLEFSVPIRLIPSSNPNRFHLYIEAVVEWADMEAMIKLMDGSFLNPGYARNSLERKQTMLLLPGIWKRDLAAHQVVLEKDSAGNTVTKGEPEVSPSKPMKESF